MARDYAALINLAADLEMVRGYRTTAQDIEDRKLRSVFDAARNRFVYDLLAEGGAPAELEREVNAEIDELIALTPDWSSTLEFVRSEVGERLWHEAGKSPLRRKLIRFAPLAAGIACLLVYGGVRIGSAVDIDQPLESRAGLVQRAEALHKVVRYDDWNGTEVRRGGFIKPLLLWPIEPTDPEVEGGLEFAALAFSAGDLLTRQGAACAVPIYQSGTLSAEQVAFVDKVAIAVADDNMKWESPPADTVLRLVAFSYPCAKSLIGGSR